MTLLPIALSQTGGLREGDRVFVHTHGGAWVFGGGDSLLREAVWLAVGVGVNTRRTSSPVANTSCLKSASVVGVRTKVFDSCWIDIPADGDLFTVEPGLYHEQLRAGVRIEQNDWLTAVGLERLRSYSTGIR